MVLLVSHLNDMRGLKRFKMCAFYCHLHSRKVNFWWSEIKSQIKGKLYWPDERVASKSCSCLRLRESLRKVYWPDERVACPSQ